MIDLPQPLYEKLPEIYRIRDGKLQPENQLKAYVELFDDVLTAVRDDISGLYDDLFVETCSESMIPYIADLLGTSHLAGPAWTVRSDVARTIFHRRRKGTLGAIESLTYSLTGWAAHAVEMRNRLLRNQHLNHQRPDAGGQAPHAMRPDIYQPVRGGTVNLRSPAILRFLNGPFDEFGHVIDVKPIGGGSSGHNLAVLAIFLWRLAHFRLQTIHPKLRRIEPLGGNRGSLQFYAHPLGEIMELFNTFRFDPDAEPPDLSQPDAVPGPMPIARLSQDGPASRWEEYVALDFYSPAVAPKPADVGLTFHMPRTPFAGKNWRIRGANLCAWEKALRPALRNYEIVIDPRHGKFVIGVPNRFNHGDILKTELLITPTYGFSGSPLVADIPGSTGAHPVARPRRPGRWQGQVPTIVTVQFDPSRHALQEALASIPTLPARPLIIEIVDNEKYLINLADIRLKRSLWIRAASGKRPVIVVRQPLKFRPEVIDAASIGQIAEMNVRLEGLHISRDRLFNNTAGATAALVEQAAVNRLRIVGCTLDPGNAVKLDGTSAGTRKPTRDSLQLDRNFGLAAGPERSAFRSANQLPEIVIDRTISGPLAISENYSLELADSILDAGSGAGASNPALAVRTHDPANAEDDWGPPTVVSGLTCFGRMRVTRINGSGGIWVHALRVHDNQYGCIKFSYFSGDNDRLPPNHGCVSGPDQPVRFVSDVYGQSGYAQLRLDNRREILHLGPGNDEMGAFGFLRNSHRYKNIAIRYREFIPVGVQPLVVPVT